jgi:hypothetical protein
MNGLGAFLTSKIGRHFIVSDYSHVDVASTTTVKIIHILCLLQKETLNNLVEDDFINLCQYGEYDELANLEDYLEKEDIYLYNSHFCDLDLKKVKNV